jgi:hypothetical protein
MKLLDYKLLDGYAYKSSKRRPIDPETVVVGEEEIAACRCVGTAMIDGLATYLAFKVRGRKTYYFQNRPW